MENFEFSSGVENCGARFVLLGILGSTLLSVPFWKFMKFFEIYELGGIFFGHVSFIRDSEWDQSMLSFRSTRSIVVSLGIGFLKGMPCASIWIKFLSVCHSSFTALAPPLLGVGPSFLCRLCNSQGSSSWYRYCVIQPLVS